MIEEFEVSKLYQMFNRNVLWAKIKQGLSDKVDLRNSLLELLVLNAN